MTFALPSQEPMLPSLIFVCRDCSYLSVIADEDKCPHCHSDDWVRYVPAPLCPYCGTDLKPKYPRYCSDRCKEMAKKEKES